MGLVVVFILWNLFLCMSSQASYDQLKFLLTHKKINEGRRFPSGTASPRSQHI